MEIAISILLLDWGRVVVMDFASENNQINQRRTMRRGDGSFMHAVNRIDSFKTPDFQIHQHQIEFQPIFIAIQTAVSLFDTRFVFKTFLV